MKILNIGGKEVPFVFGIAVSEEYKSYIESKPKPDTLKEYLKWRKQCVDEGLDVSDITIDVWQSQQPPAKRDVFTDDLMIYYLCYKHGCKKQSIEPMVFEKFKEVIDADYRTTIGLMSDAIAELSGTKDAEDPSLKNG